MLRQSTCSNPHKLGCAVVQVGAVHLLETGNQVGELFLQADPNLKMRPIFRWPYPEGFRDGVWTYHEIKR